MKVQVDLGRCQGHGHCWGIESPAVFAPLDDDGHARVLVDEVPEDQEDEVLRAERLCPERAITVVEDE